MEPLADCGVTAWWQRLGLPGVIDIHTHFLPERMLRRVWAHFDEAGPLIGRSWPIEYRWNQDSRLAHLRQMGVRHFTALTYAHRPGMAADLTDFALERRVVAHMALSLSICACCWCVYIAGFLLRMSPDEVIDQMHDGVQLFIQGEVPGVEQVQFSGGKIIEVRACACLREELIVAPPGQKHGGLMFAHPRLPRGIQRDVGLVIIE